jgi:hypothetical protein
LYSLLVRHKTTRLSSQLLIVQTTFVKLDLNLVDSLHHQVHFLAPRASKLSFNGRKSEASPVIFDLVVDLTTSISRNLSNTSTKPPSPFFLRTRPFLDTKMDWMNGPLKGFFVSRRLQSSSQQTSSVQLIPFDITLAVVGSQVVDSVALTVTVAQWMDDNFAESVAALNYKYKYGQVVLRELVKGERVQSSYKVTYEGMTYWGMDRQIPTATSVAAMQLQGLGNQESLLAKLQAVSADTGLGSAIVDARADLNSDAMSTQTQAPTTSSGSMDGILVAAIIIAIFASLLLAFALFMSWRSAKSRKEAYHEGTVPSDVTGTHEDRGFPSADPKYNTAGPYPDSVITDDIASSLSAYYKQGMAGGYKSSRDQSGGLNDAASVSSMESYGYSLDGYASSITNA